MAQDLETTHPDALVTGADGFYRVNYSKLGVRMMRLEQTPPTARFQIEPAC